MKGINIQYDYMDRGWQGLKKYLAMIQIQGLIHTYGNGRAEICVQDKRDVKSLWWELEKLPVLKNLYK